MYICETIGHCSTETTKSTFYNPQELKVIALYFATADGSFNQLYTYEHFTPEVLSTGYTLIIKTPWSCDHNN